MNTRTSFGLFCLIALICRPCFGEDSDAIEEPAPAAVQESEALDGAEPTPGFVEELAVEGPPNPAAALFPAPQCSPTPTPLTEAEKSALTATVNNKKSEINSLDVTAKNTDISNLETKITNVESQARNVKTLIDARTEYYDSLWVPPILTLSLLNNLKWEIIDVIYHISHVFEMNDVRDLRDQAATQKSDALAKIDEALAELAKPCPSASLITNLVLDADSLKDSAEDTMEELSEKLTEVQAKVEGLRMEKQSIYTQVP